MIIDDIAADLRALLPEDIVLLKFARYQRVVLRYGDGTLRLSAAQADDLIKILPPLPGRASKAIIAKLCEPAKMKIGYSQRRKIARNLRRMRQP